MVRKEEKVLNTERQTALSPETSVALISVLYSEFIKQYKDGIDSSTVTLLEQFDSHVDEVYETQSDRDLLHNAAKLATVLYQYNEDIPRRRRKKTADKAGHLPLMIYHPLSAGMVQAGMSRPIFLEEPRTGEAIEVPVHQKPAKAEIVAALLLHDVFEDVTINGFSGEGLVPIFRSFLGANNQTEEVILLVQALTNEQLDIEGKIPQDLKDLMESSDFYKKFVEQVKRRVSSDQHGQVEFQVMRSLIDTNNMFQKSFGTEGKKPDPKAYSRFFAAFSNRTHDIENNLEAPSKNEKLIRTHLFAVLARALGLPIANRLAIHLIAHQQYNIHGGDSDLSEAQWDLIRKYAEAEQLQQPLNITIEREDEVRTLPVSGFQIPILTHNERILGPGGDINPALQYEVKMSDKKELEKYLDNDNSELSVTIGEIQGTARRMHADIHKLVRLTGREVVYYEVEDSNGNTIALLKFIDDKPTAQNVLEDGSNIESFDVPESALFEQYDGTLTSMFDILKQFYPFPER